jgi:large subunit ribosomal protein L23
MNSHDVIKKPLLTEKSSRMSERENKYSFRVAKSANKIEIRKAVEELFSVKVTSVNTVMMRGKKKRVRHRLGKTPDWKKAVVSLIQSDKIDFA